MRISLRICSLLCTTMLMTSFCAYGQLTHFKNIDGPTLFPLGINSTGALAGYYCCGFDNFLNLVDQGFLLLGDGAFRTIQPTGTSGFVSGINKKSMLVGGYCDTLNCASLVGQHGFMLAGLSLGGGFTVIDYPGALSTVADGINSANQIVGTYCAHVGTCLFQHGDHGFLDDNGVFTAIDFPGGVLTSANGINDAGQIVGSYNSQGKTHGFLLSAGVYTTIDPPGTSLTNAEGINNSGEIVGTYLDTSNHEHGFMYVGGVYTTIDRPGATSTSADGVNDAGTVVGTASNATQVHGYTAKP